jgi:hypothetical protein
MALPAGFAPASVRLEDECLILFGHGSHLKLVSAAGFAPAIPRSQAERVAPTLRADGGPEGSCTLNPPADNGALCWLSYESEMVGSAGNAPVRHFQFCFPTPDLQSGNWITSLKLVAGVGVAPT